MKKFNLKTILILVLALVLVFSLVACNDDDDAAPSGPQAVSTSEYFNTLLNSAKSINSGNVKEDSNLLVDLDLGLGIRLENSTGSQQYGSIAIGVAGQILLDRTTEDGINSAAKLQLYNADSPANARENWFTVYYFLNDASHIYIEFDDQQFVIGIDTGYNTGDYANHYAKVIRGILMKTDDTDPDSLSLNQIINGILVTAEDKEWSLDNVINTVLAMTGFDLEKLITGNQMIANLLGQYLNIDELFGEDGSLRLDTLLGSGLMPALFDESKTSKITENGVTSYTTQLTGLLDTILGFIPNSGGITSLLSGSTLQLSYDVIGTELDAFTLSAKLPALIANRRIPVIELRVNELNIAPVAIGEDVNASATLMGVNKADFKDQFTFDTSISFDSKGFTITPADMSRPWAGAADEQVKLDGTFTLDIKTCIDLLNKTDNKTQMYAELTYKNGSEAAVNIAALSFDGSTLALSVNNDATTANGTKIMETLADSLGKGLLNLLKGINNGAVADAVGVAIFNEYKAGDYAALQGKEYTYNTGFKGAAIENINIPDLWKKLLDEIKKLADSIKNANTAAVADAASEVYSGDYVVSGSGDNAVYANTSEKSYELSVNMTSAIKAIVQYVSLKDGNTVGISVSDLAKVASGLFSAQTYKGYKIGTGGQVEQTLTGYAPTTGEELLARIFAYNDDWVKKFTDLGIIDTYKVGDKVYYQATTMLKKSDYNTMWRYATGVHNYAYYAEQCREKGITPASEDDFNAIIATLAPSVFNKAIAGSAFLANKDGITAIAAGKADISISFADGFEFTAELKVSDDAYAKVTFSAEVSEYNADDYKVVSVPAEDRTGWLIYKIPVVEKPAPAPVA